VVVQAPEMGDEIQAMKAGLLEVADIVVVNKADRPGADRAAAQLRAMLSLGAHPEPSAGAERPRPKRPEILLASGLEGKGVAELLLALDEHHAGRQGDAPPHAARLARARAQVEGILADRTREALWSGARSGATDELMEQVASHQLDPYAAADRLLRTL
jgi:LAO/AO transport system kinase